MYQKLQPVSNLLPESNQLSFPKVLMYETVIKFSFVSGKTTIMLHVKSFTNCFCFLNFGSILQLYLQSYSQTSHYENNLYGLYPSGHYLVLIWLLTQIFVADYYFFSFIQSDVYTYVVFVCNLWKNMNLSICSKRHLLNSVIESVILNCTVLYLILNTVETKNYFFKRLICFQKID